MEATTSSPEETEEIAGRLAANLRAGDVVTVSGESIHAENWIFTVPDDPNNP